MRITKKIKAFTLAELLVVLVLSIIVIGIAFSALNIINKNFNEYRSWYLSLSQKRELEAQLSIDFHRSTKIQFYKSQNKLILKTYKGSVEMLEYTFLQNEIIIQSDTLEIPYKSYNFFFNGTVIENGQVDGLKIIFSDSEKDFLFISKFNSSKNLMSDEI